MDNLISKNILLLDLVISYFLQLLHTIIIIFNKIRSFNSFKTYQVIFYLQRIFKNKYFILNIFSTNKFAEVLSRNISTIIELLKKVE